MDEIKASMENGVLSVVVPKEEQKKPQVKAIDISDKKNNQTKKMIKTLKYSTTMVQIQHIYSKVPQYLSDDPQSPLN
ncbi:hypothetical protein Leryth_000110 [Lithospermum erythrorhizon]|nr:hypothetical protein Leryth_000110 [Lithospermum erythrorhizon]